MGMFDALRRRNVQPDAAGVYPTHLPLATMDNQALMAQFRKKDVASGALFGGWQAYGGSYSQVYRSGPARLSRLQTAYGGTVDSVSWVFSCISLIASTAAAYDWRFVTSDGGETIDAEKAPADLRQLLERPNDQWTYFDLIEAILTDLELVGNCYLLKNEANGMGQPKSLHRLIPDRMRIVLAPDGTEIGYVYTPHQSIQIPYELDEIMHFKYPNPLDQHYGMGTVEALANALDRENAQDLHITGFFQNGARISGVLTVQGTMTETQFERLKQSYSEQFAGPASAYKMLLAEAQNGVDYKPITSPPAAAGVVDLFKLSKDEILSGFGVPEFLLGGAHQAGVEKMEEAQNIFLRTMIPKARRVSERLSIDVTQKWGGVDIRLDAHAHEPMSVKIEYAKGMISGGATLNEAREAMGLPESDDPLADQILVPNNLIPLSIVGLPPRPPHSIPMENQGESGWQAEPGTPGAQPELPSGGGGSLRELPAAVATSGNGGPPEEPAKGWDGEDWDRLERMLADAKTVDGPADELDDLIGRLEALEAQPSASEAINGACDAWGKALAASERQIVVQVQSAPAAAEKAAEEPTSVWMTPEYPPGFERVTDAPHEIAKRMREVQARVLRHGVDVFGGEMRRFFKGQRNRVLHALATFGKGVKGRAKGDITADAIFDTTAEDAALVKTYLDALDQVGRNALSALPADLGGVIDWDLSNPRVEAMRGKLAALVTRVNRTTRDEIANVITEGLRRGYSVTQLANGYADEKYGGVIGVFDQTDARAEMIARTESAFALNGAQAAGFREAGVGWVEVLDGTGDEECADANGSTWTVDEYESEPLGHPNCVRTAVPTSAPEGESTVE